MSNSPVDSARAAAVEISSVSHRYGARLALHEINLTIPTGEIFGLLGPNGGGKSTLMKLLSTLLPVQSGRIQVCGQDVLQAGDAVRRRIAVAFQSPSLDLKLTVRENLLHQGHLYGLWGAALRTRIAEVLDLLNLRDRTTEFAEKLSGGLRRRVELAKCLLHAPEVLLLDEPSTGLDPRARLELWEALEQFRRNSGMTVVVSTHLMEEADRCDRLGLLDQGVLIALGTPAKLRASAGQQSITIVPIELEEFARDLAAAGWNAQQVGGALKLHDIEGLSTLERVAAEFSGRFRTITLGMPTLEDTFIRLTGRGLNDEPAVTTPVKSH